MPNRPPVALSKGRGGGFSINSRLGIRSCNSSLSKGPLSPGLVPLAILAGGEGSGRHSYAWKVFQTEMGEYDLIRKTRNMHGYTMTQFLSKRVDDTEIMYIIPKLVQVISDTYWRRVPHPTAYLNHQYKKE